MKTKKFKVVKTTAFAMLCALSFGAINVKATTLLPSCGLEVKYDSILKQKYESGMLYTFYTKCTLEKDITLHYSINDETEKTYTHSCNVDDQFHVFYNLDLGSYDLKSKAENQLKYYYTDSAGNKSETLQTDIIQLVKEESVVVSNDFLNVELYDVPYATKLNLTKVTDKNIINKVGTDYIYKIDLEADGKPLSYYDNKYGISRLYTPRFSGSFPNGLSKDNKLKIYLTNSDFSAKDEIANCSLDDDGKLCDDKYDFISAATEVGYNFSNGYIYFKYGDEDRNSALTKTQEVKVADTAMNVSSVIYVISALSIVAGISIIAGITMKARKN